MRVAIVTMSGTVTHVVVVDEPDQAVPPEGSYTVPLDDETIAGPEWTYADGEFSPPDQP